MWELLHKNKVIFRDVDRQKCIDEAIKLKLAVLIKEGFLSEKKSMYTFRNGVSISKVIKTANTNNDGMAE